MFGPWKMPKNDFLSLINVDRNLYTWDGEKNNTFNIIRDLPDEIGFKEFEEAIFLNSIEEHKNNYFFQLFMKEALSLMKTKGENAFDLFEKVSQRPLSTYTVEEDVYGDVISVKRNKPNLKLLNNWTK